MRYIPVIFKVFFSPMIQQMFPDFPVAIGEWVNEYTN